MEKKLRIVLFFVVVFLFFGLVPSRATPQVDEKAEKSLSAFPILMYDTDIGLGYGGKAKFVDYFFKKESFDFIVFNSTKGERWYVFAFSIPDIEIRQGKRYALSFDFKAEYDKFLNYSFYGMGIDSNEQDEAVFAFEKKELQLKVGKGFTPHFVMEVSYSFKNVRYFNVEEDTLFTNVLKEVAEKFSPFASLVIRYDTSDSQVHPRRGIRLLFQNDVASGFLGNKNATFHRFTLDFRKYILLLGNKDVLAFRGLLQKISGKRIPLFEMSVLGGGSELTAMRGYGLNRFLDKGKFLINAEYRFPLWKRVGGNVFVDGGCTWPSFSGIKLNKIVMDFGVGLRYYLQNFVVRFDTGFSDEGIGIYFNFGHVF